MSEPLALLADSGWQPQKRGFSTLYPRSLRDKRNESVRTRPPSTMKSTKPFGWSRQQDWHPWFSLSFLCKKSWCDFWQGLWVWLAEQLSSQNKHPPFKNLRPKIKIRIRILYLSPGGNCDLKKRLWESHLFLVISHLDHCISLCVGLDQSSLCHLQEIENEKAPFQLYQKQYQC